MMNKSGSVGAKGGKSAARQEARRRPKPAVLASGVLSHDRVLTITPAEVKFQLRSMKAGQPQITPPCSDWYI